MNIAFINKAFKHGSYGSRDNEMECKINMSGFTSFFYSMIMNLAPMLKYVNHYQRSVDL